MKLQTHCLVSLRGIKSKKTSYELKTLGFFINCSLYWPMPVFQASAPRPSYCHSTKYSSMARTSYLNYINSGIRSKLNWIMRAHIESALVLWVWGSQSCRNQTMRLEKSGQKGWRTTMKKLMEYCTTRLPFVLKAIQTELISQYHDNPLAGHFGINKTKDLVGRKYYWPSLWKDIEAYVKGCDVCLGSKAVRHKPYGDLQSLPVPTHRWKDLLMDFVTGLPISTD